MSKYSDRAPWFRLRLPSCSPGFESQAQHLRFFNLYNWCWNELRGRDWPIFCIKKQVKGRGCGTVGRAVASTPGTNLTKKLFYSEIKHSNWIFQVMWWFLTDRSALLVFRLERSAVRIQSLAILTVICTIEKPKYRKEAGKCPFWMFLKS